MTDTEIADSLAALKPHLTAARRAKTPEERARALTRLIAEVPKVYDERRLLVAHLHEEQQWSWAQIGAALDMHPQRAAQIGKGVSGGRKRWVPTADTAAPETG